FSAGGSALWASDLTAAGTKLVKDLGAGGARLTQLTAFNGALYFVRETHHDVEDHSAGDYTYRYYTDELWKSDGTAAGTKLVEALTINDLAAVNGKLFLAVDDDNDTQLWASDGTAAGTRFLKDLDPRLGPTFKRVRDALLFAADDGTHGTE